MSEQEIQNQQKSATDSNNLPNSKPNRGLLKGASSSPGGKFIITGIITFLLIIPALLVWGLVEERANRADEVARTISQGWGNAQRLNGPYLVIPYITTQKRANDTYYDVRRFAIYSPKELDIISELSVEERKKSIYTTPLYHKKSNLKGVFNTPDLSEIRARNGRPRVQEAFIAIEVSDLAGFRSEVDAKLNGITGNIFQPGLNGISPSPQAASDYSNYNQSTGKSNSSGIHLKIDEALTKEEITFDINLTINGSRSLEIVPSGKTTKISMRSDWPHPGFDGRFLPETRDVSEEGFNANWTIPNLARGISEVSLSSTMMETSSVVKISFVKPLKFYQLVSRTLKYAIAFFSLVFLAIFILELTSNSNVHWIQYILTGLAMVVFYILLLALAEQIGFTWAYLIAALATTSLVAWYVGNALESKNAIVVLAFVIGLTYAIMYLILKEDEYALVIGAVIAFAAIAFTMFATRNVDWSRSATAVDDLNQTNAENA